jgi:hypothetical protein
MVDLSLDSMSFWMELRSASTWDRVCWDLESAPLKAAVAYFPGRDSSWRVAYRCKPRTKRKREGKTEPEGEDEGRWGKSVRGVSLYRVSRAKEGGGGESIYLLSVSGGGVTSSESRGGGADGEHSEGGDEDGSCEEVWLQVLERGLFPSTFSFLLYVRQIDTVTYIILRLLLWYTDSLLLFLRQSCPLLLRSVLDASSNEIRQAEEAELEPEGLARLLQGEAYTWTK